MPRTHLETIQYLTGDEVQDIKQYLTKQVSLQDICDFLTAKGVPSSKSMLSRYLTGASPMTPVIAEAVYQAAGHPATLNFLHTRYANGRAIEDLGGQIAREKKTLLGIHSDYSKLRAALLAELDFTYAAAKNRAQEGAVLDSIETMIRSIPRKRKKNEQLDVSSSLEEACKIESEQSDIPRIIEQAYRTEGEP